LANNPTCIALHEAKQIWPSYKDNYVIVSVGNGRYKPTEFYATKASSISLKQKINRIVSGVSDPETIHKMLIDLMPGEKYFRFNPFMTEEFNLDENRPTKWQLMQYETNMYMRRNESKFEMATKQLLKPKSPLQKAEEFLYNNNYVSAI
jgi:calcium-independent phospholipase A2-gamma